MKSFKLISATLALAAVMSTGCEEEVFYGIDESKPAPEAFTYDATNSSPAVIAVYWDARAAVEAGATGFTVQANTTSEGGGDNYDATIAKTLLVDEEGVYDAATFNQLAPGASYYLRVRANYPNSVYSKWVYLEGEGTFVTLATPSITKTVIGAYGISVFWSPVTNATGYVVEYKTASSNWTAVTVEKATNIDINGLTPETSYTVRVKATKGDLASAYSADKSVKTIAPAEFPISLGSAEEMYLLFSGQDLLTAGPNDKVLLTADIDLTGKELGEISKFAGIFDGQGHKIKNLVSNHPLFTMNTGTIQNVVIDASCKFTVETPVFGVICATNQGTIENVTTNVDLEYAINDAAEEAILIAGMAGESTGAIKNCTNNGAVSIISKAGIYAAGASGMAAYQAGAPVEGCTNNGDITIKSLYTTDKSVAVGELGKAVPCIGGLVAYCGPGFTMDNCINSGKITFSQTAIDQTATKNNLNRHMLGGVVGASHGNISNSSNYGDINITGLTTDNSAYAAIEYNFCTGGISGGEYFVSGKGGNDVTNIVNCKNTGKITVAFDASKANSTLGGIVGWPCEESASTVVTDKCTNEGDIVLSGNGKLRVGGIHGGSGILTNCKNTGNITVSSAASSSVVGLVAGFHSGGYAYDHNEAYGSLNVECALDGAAALIGNIGNAKHTKHGMGCKVNADIQAKDVTNVGMIVGKFNGSTQTITLGTEAEPIKIMGSLNGTALNEGNYAGYLWGPTNYTADTHSFITAFGE